MKSIIKGILGKMVANFSLWAVLDKEIYHCLNNVTLLKDNGATTQIDHIIVSKYGFFVIETKNYSG